MYKDVFQVVEDVKRCKKCRLCENALNAVPGVGNYASKIIFIGEAPGRDEDIKGEPFVGAAGKFLTLMLNQIGFQREDVYITNIVKHRPPNNRDPFEDEIEACFLYLAEQIRLIDPLLIVTLGRHAMNRFLPGLKISEVHGQAKRGKGIHKAKQVYLPLYHPASALYNPGLRNTLLLDMQKIPVLLKKLSNDT
jgi:uracil-DNA glycosylase